MKKCIFKFLFIILLLTSSVQAQTLKVISMEPFSTAEPSPTYTVKILEPIIFPDGVILDAETYICGNVTRIQSPQRGKRNSYFVLNPTLAVFNDKTISLEKYRLEAKVVGYKPIEPAKLAVSAAKKATNLFFKGASLGISFAEGVAQAEDGNRLKSGLTKSYKDSPLSYIEAGKELNVAVGDILILSFKINNY